jgi:hypothetical protein
LDSSAAAAAGDCQAFLGILRLAQLIFLLLLVCLPVCIQRNTLQKSNTKYKIHEAI